MSLQARDFNLENNDNCLPEFSQTDAQLAYLWRSIPQIYIPVDYYRKNVRRSIKNSLNMLYKSLACCLTAVFAQENSTQKSKTLKQEQIEVDAAWLDHYDKWEKKLAILQKEEETLWTQCSTQINPDVVNTHMKNSGAKK
jgi:hypothetical protein